MTNKYSLQKTEKIDQMENKNSKLRFSFSTLSLRRKKKDKDLKPVDQLAVEAKENDYEVIDSHFIKSQSVKPRNTNQSITSQNIKSR